MTKFRLGDRIVDTRTDEFGNSFLGYGTVLKGTNKLGLVEVLFDFPPPVDHNQGQNPTSVFDYHIRKVDE